VRVNLGERYRANAAKTKTIASNDETRRLALDPMSSGTKKHLSWFNEKLR